MKKIRFSYYVSLTALSLAAVSLPSLYASAADLDPTSGWSVTRVDEPSGPYCTLARQYEGGAVVTLGRNITEEYSLAIDYREARFDMEKSYKLSLQPGPGQIRAYELMPASTGAMVIRLGWDESFFESLDKSGELKVDISGNKDTFAMPDIMAGQKDLSACLKGLKQETASVGGSKKDVLSAEPGQASQGFEAKKVTAADKAARVAALAPAAGGGHTASVKMSDEISRLKAENAQLSQTLTEERKRYELQMTKAPSENRVSELEEKISLLERENADMKAKMPAGQEKDKLMQEQAQKLSGLEADLRKARAENESLNKQLDLAHAEAEKAAKQKPTQVIDARAIQKAKTLEAEVERLQVENDRLTLAVNDHSGDEDAQKKLAAQVAQLKSENARLAQVSQDGAADKEAQKDLSAEVARLKADNARLAQQAKEAAVTDTSEQKAQEAQLAQLRADNKKLKADMEKMAQEKEDMRVASAGDDDGLKKATLRYNEAEREIRRLGNALEDERQAHAKEKADLEKMLFDPAIADKAQVEHVAELENELTDLREQLASSSKTPDKVVETKPDPKDALRIKNLTNENDNLRGQVSSLQQELTMSKKQLGLIDAKADDQKEVEKLEQKVSTLENQLRAAKSDIGRLQLELSNAQTESGSRSDITASLKLQIEKMRNQLSLRENESLTYKNQLAAAQQETARLKSALAQQVAMANTAPAAPVPVARDQGAALNQMAPAAGAAMAVPAKAPPRPVEKKAVSQTQYLGEVRDTLSRAGLQLTSNVAPVSGGLPGNNVEVYSWKAGKLYGRGEVWPMASSSDFNGLVRQHIGSLKSRCGGDFASVPTSEASGKSYYEVACVTPQGSTSASILFYSDRGHFYVMSHETAAQDMDLAMDARDRVGRAVR